MTVSSRISTLMRGQPVEIVGVMPDGLDDPAGYFEFWIPLVSRDPIARRDLKTPPANTAGVQVFGRLKPGVSLEAAAEEATVLFSAIRKSANGPDADTPRRMLVTPVKTDVVKPVRPALQVRGGGGGNNIQLIAKGDDYAALNTWIQPIFAAARV